MMMAPRDRRRGTQRPDRLALLHNTSHRGPVRSVSPKKKRGFETARGSTHTHASETPPSEGQWRHVTPRRDETASSQRRVTAVESAECRMAAAAPRPCSPRRCRTADSRRHRRRRRRRRPPAAPGARRRAAAAPRPREKREWCVTRGARVAALFFPAKSHNTVGRSATDHAPPPAVSARRARARARRRP